MPRLSEAIAYISLGSVATAIGVVAGGACHNSNQESARKDAPTAVVAPVVVVSVVISDAVVQKTIVAAIASGAIPIAAPTSTPTGAPRPPVSPSSPGTSTGVVKQTYDDVYINGVHVHELKGQCTGTPGLEVERGWPPGFVVEVATLHDHRSGKWAMVPLRITAQNCTT